MTWPKSVLIKTACPMPIMAEIVIKCRVGVWDRHGRGIWIKYTDLPVIEARLDSDCYNTEVTIEDFKALFIRKKVKPCRG